MMAARAGVGSLIVALLVSALVVVMAGSPAGAVETPPSFVETWGESGADIGQFREPYDVAVGPDGSVYVADLLNQRIQRFTSTGTPVTAWGTFGTGNGQFHDPYGVTVDNEGYVYVADEYNHRIQKFTSNGTFVAKWGSNGTANGQFQGPVGVAVDDDGFVYVADNYNHRIQKFTSNGTFVAKWGTLGTGNGQFDRAYGLAVDADGFVYVADYGNHRIQKFTSTGVFVAKWGSLGSGDGQFNIPVRVAVDDRGGVYVADSNNYRVEKFTSTGTYLSDWGSPGDGEGEFGGAYGIAAGPTGEVYVADTANHRLQVFGDTTDPTVTLTSPTDGATVSLDEVVAADFSCADEAGGSGIATCAGTVPDGSPVDTSPVGDHDFTVTGTDRAGNSTEVTGTYTVVEPPPRFVGEWGTTGQGGSQFDTPLGLTVSPDGSVYVADTFNHRIQRFDARGSFIAQWGISGTGNGQFNKPIGLAFGLDGSVYVADQGNHRIQRFNAEGAFMSKWGGLGTGNGQFTNPTGVAVAPDGSVYVSDQSNYRIQHFNAAGVFIEKWGGLGRTDGRFDNPSGVAVAADGSVYVADTSNHRVQRFTGHGTFLDSWTSLPSSLLSNPYGISVGPDGSVYVVDGSHHRIQKFTADGDFVSKWGTLGSGDGEFHAPAWVAVGTTGEVYVADSLNHRVQHFSYDVTDPTVTLVAPPDGEVYSRNDEVAADYSCTDQPGGSGIDTCVGTVANGAPIDTSTVGDHDFTVTGTDRAGNTRQVTHTYHVLDSGVTGTVRENAVGDPIGEGIWVVALRASDFTLAAGGFTDPQSRFRLLVPAGSYYLYLIDPTGAHTTGFHGAPTQITVSPSAMVQTDPVMAPTGGRVLGTITDENDGRNLTDTAWAVAVNASTGTTEAVANNNFNGFDFPNLAPGRHLLIFLDATGAHRPEYYDDAAGPDTATSLLVNPGDQITVNVEMAAATPPVGGGPLSGTVTEQGTGIPLPGVRVVALHAATYQFAASATTNPNTGTYTLNLNPGDYKIAFIEPTGRHSMEWHNNLPSHGLASADTVTTPGVVNAALNPITATMAGTITDNTTSTPVPGAWVLAIGPTGISGGAVTSTNGTYTITGLTPGTYRAAFVDPNGGRTLEYHQDSPDYFGATPFNLTAGTTTTINAALASPTSE